MWELQWGKQLEFLEELEEQGKDPLALRNRPVLGSGLSHYIESFFILSARRPVNNVEGAIPISEIVAYLSLYPWYDNDLFMRCIILLDNTYLQHKKDSYDNKDINFKSKNRP